MRTIKLLKPFVGFILLLIVFTNRSVAQDMGSYSLKKGLKITGGLNFSTMSYTTTGIESRRDPFNWFATGNLNIDMFGYAMPFSFSISNASKNYTQPFNQIKFSPQYKWIKTYLGDASMNFSNYTLSGHRFSGAGVELTPGKWNISLMYGKLNKAVQYDIIQDNLNTLSFDRKGYAAKIGYADKGDSYEFCFFSAKDDTTSLAFVPKDAELTPMKNMAVSTAIKKKITGRIFADIEYGLSALTPNMYSTNKVAGNTSTTGSNFLNPLYKNKNGVTYFDAINTGIGYNGDAYGVQLRYERVAPGYKTLGAYYFNNDLQNITIAPNLRLLESRLNINGNIGIQKNNLDHTRADDSKRFAGNITIAFAPSGKWNYTLAYSNFATYTNMRPQADPTFQNDLDTLNFYQITDNINVALSHSFGDDETKQTLMFNTTYQKASEQAGEGQSLSGFITGNVTYSRTVAKKELAFSTALNYSNNDAMGVRSIFWGPNVNVSKGLMKKKIKLSCSTAYNSATTGNQSANAVITSRVGVNYSPDSKNEKGKEKKKTGRHSVSMNINYTNKLSANVGQPKYSELTSTMNYSYQF